MGYGYQLPRKEKPALEVDWSTFAEKCPKVRGVSSAEYAVVIDSTLSAARDLANHVFGPIPVHS